MYEQYEGLNDYAGLNLTGKQGACGRPRFLFDWVYHCVVLSELRVEANSNRQYQQQGEKEGTLVTSGNCLRSMTSSIGGNQRLLK